MTKRPSIDGFVPRRPTASVGRPITTSSAQGGAGLPRAEQGLIRHDVSSRTGLTAASGDSVTEPIRLSRSDIDESLNSIDQPEVLSRKERRKQRKATHSKRRKIIKWIVLAIIAVVLAIGGYLAYKALSTTSSVFKGSIFGLVEQKKLQQDENGRTNILILGTSEDDPGHEGAYLTDSIMVLSIDQTKKNAYTMSIPRDLYVKYGMACNSGYAGKVNEFFNCVNSDYDNESAENERQEAARKFFGNIVGLDIQYSAHVNYSVMRDLVSALGSITVTIESRDPRGQMDSNFDWKCKGGNAYASHATMVKNCPPSGHFIDYPNGPATLDAEHALYLAQARGDIAPTYGFEQSNFDREKNQQKILVAIREKAMSGGTLTDLNKVTGILDAIGNNLRTNFDTSEVRTLVSLAKDIPSSAIQSVSFIDADPALFTTSNVNGMSVVVPSAGLYDYSKIQSFIQKKINASPIEQENAHVMVLNASGVAGAAQTQADKLEALGMTIDAVDNAPDGTKEGVNVVYQVGKTAKSNTAAKLSSLYGVKPKVVTGIDGVTLGDDTDYVIIVGKAADSSEGTSQ